MDEVMERVYQEVNNGVYRCGFSTSQRAYDKAYSRLFTALDWLEERLEHRRYLMGGQITEADVRLFTTLARFDAVYHGVHKDINPTQIIPSGPDTAHWLIAHDRDQLGDRPFGDGTPPGPVFDGEEVPADHGPGGIPHR